MSFHQRYETHGRELIKEIESLPESHALRRVVTESRRYRAILEDDPNDPEWKSHPTAYGVPEAYLFRFDLIAELTHDIMEFEETPWRFKHLADNLQQARAALFERATDKRTIDLLEGLRQDEDGRWLITEEAMTRDGGSRGDIDRVVAFVEEIALYKEQLEQVGLSVNQAFSLIARQAFERIQQEVKKGLDSPGSIGGDLKIFPDPSEAKAIVEDLIRTRSQIRER